MQNLYNNGGFYWWNGVVEDRDDPLLLGRCRVRILGYHNPNKTVLPTVDLPWAYPVQSITSAAMNGIGNSPVGPVEGTWILGFFRDGDDCQEPVMLGTIGGVPQVDETLYETRNPTTDESTSTTPPVTDPAGNVYVNKVSNESVTPPTPNTVTLPVDGVIGPLSQDEIDSLLDTLAMQTDRAYTTVDPDGNLGAYRLSASTLVDFGYISQGAQAQYTKAGSADYAANAQGLIDPAVAYSIMPDSKKSSFNFFCIASTTLWTQKSGGTAVEFLGHSTIQDTVMQLSLKAHYRFLYRSEIVNSDTSKGDVAGYLTLCHLLGQSAARDYRNGIVKTFNNVNAATYYNLGFKAVGGVTGLSNFAGTASQSPEQIANQTQPVAPPTPPTVASQKQNSDLVQTTPDVGFADPNKVYPKTAFIGEPDTNRLARHQKVVNTIVGKKDANRMKAIPLALDKGTWDQPPVPFNAKYPYNHVFESESGHIEEFDDTAGNERIHRYHKSGTFTEVDVNGTRVTRIVGDDYVILERNGYVFINGKANVTVGGTCNVKILGDCNLEVDGVFNALFHNDANIGIAGNLKLMVNGTFDVASKGAMKIGTTDQMDVRALGAMRIGSDETIYVKADGVNVESATDLNLKASKQVKLEAGTVANIKSGTKTSITAGTELGLKATAAIKVGAGGILGLDGGGLAILSGVGLSATPAESADSANPATDPSAGNAGDIKMVSEPVFPVLQVPTRSEEFAYALDGLTENLDSNSAQIAEVKAQAIADGTVNEEDFMKEPTPGTVDTTVVPVRTPVDPGCADLSGLTEFAPSLQLSEHFTLGMLSSGAVVTKVAVQELHNLTKEEIVCNLKALATQVLDPIKAHYPNMIVTSGFRTPAHSKALNSQHEFGKAADMQFNGVPKNGYLEIAQWIRDNIPYDQLLLEFKSFGSGNPWIHISYNTDRLRGEIRTMWNDKSYPDPAARALVDLSGVA